MDPQLPWPVTTPKYPSSQPNFEALKNSSQNLFVFVPKLVGGAEVAAAGQLCSLLLSEGVSVRLTSPDQEKRMFMMATIMFMVEY